MDKKIESFLKLEKLFIDRGYSLYLVGGSVRDYLLDIQLDDMDVVTDATPSEMKEFLKDANYHFEKFGSVSYKFLGVKFDITTMREEKEYSDSRHPKEINFVKDLSKDVVRRDFTVNALYLDKDLKVIDLVDGLKDIKTKTLRVVGVADNRIKEDPLRILRALRFASDYDFTIDEELSSAIKNNIDLLNKLNIEKIKLDLKKIKPTNKIKLLKLLEEYNIKHLSDVIE